MGHWGRSIRGGSRRRTQGLGKSGAWHLGQYGPLYGPQYGPQYGPMGPPSRFSRRPCAALASCFDGRDGSGFAGCARYLLARKFEAGDVVLPVPSARSPPCAWAMRGGEGWLLRARPFAHIGVYLVVHRWHAWCAGRWTTCRRRRRRWLRPQIAGAIQVRKVASCVIACSRSKAMRGGAGKGWRPRQGDAIAELICTRRMPDAG